MATDLDMRLDGHTPGPWSVIDNSWEVSTVYGPDGETVAECPINSIVTEETQFEHEAVKEANALAIGKLPDLLGLLREFVDAMERYQMDVDGDATPRHRDMMERAYSLLPTPTKAPSRA